MSTVASRAASEARRLGREWARRLASGDVEGADISLRLARACIRHHARALDHEALRQA